MFHDVVSLEEMLVMSPDHLTISCALVLLRLSCPCANFCANFSFSGCSFIQYLPNDSEGSLVLVIFKTLTAAHSTLAVSACLLLSLRNTMHTDYVDIPQPFKQDNVYIIKPYGLTSSDYAWFSTKLQFLQIQGSVRLFDRLTVTFFTAGFRVTFIQEPSVRDPFRQETNHSTTSHDLLHCFQAVLTTRSDRDTVKTIIRTVVWFLLQYCLRK